MDVLPDRHSLQAPSASGGVTDFPLRKQKLGVPWTNIGVGRFLSGLVSVWHRLPVSSLASPPVPIEVGPFIVELFAVGVFVRSPEESPSGTPCHQGRSSRRQHGCRNSHVK